jgi:pseudouridylate synthase
MLSIHISPDIGDYGLKLNKQVSSRAVALETTLLVHGVPKTSSAQLSRELGEIVSEHGSSPALIGLIDGVATVGMDTEQLETMLNRDEVPKANSANLGLYINKKLHAATTVSTTMEIASFAGLRVFATGGIGGVHEGYGSQLDISADLIAFTRYPVAVVTSGVKSILDVVSTREALESLGVTVIGYQTDSFPAFYLRKSQANVDMRFDDPDELAEFVRTELPRTGRGIVIANPIPQEHELDLGMWTKWVKKARKLASDDGVSGREVTPAILGHLHRISDGQTLEANIELVKSNAKVAAMVESRL